ncbi:MAG: FAD binding domain-containing protein [Planctomycetota bacterium]|jgi:4-hydroxybenzoyl-CoA reductase subunit beta
MLRLPDFTYYRPKTVKEAVKIAGDHGPDAMYVAGGTDLYPNMKRRHQNPKVVIGLAGVSDLSGVSGAGDNGGATLGAMTLLADIERSPQLLEEYPAVANAVALISTPLLRNMGTIGGNLLLDTRCTYYNQTFEWRESINFCMKEAGKICWVAPKSPRCWAVQSSDSVPLLCAMAAEVTLVGKDGERRVQLDELYNDDGIRYLTKKPDELLTQVHLPRLNGWTASYRKLRRRDTFDFPVLGVGVCLHQDGDVIEDVKIRIGGAGSYAIPATASEEMLRGQSVSDDLIKAASQAAFKPARPMDNTDYETGWRKKMAPIFVERALTDCLQAR